MPKNVVNKILNKVSVVSDKKDSHGIGLLQVHGALERNRGVIQIKSCVNRGTTIILTFPKTTPPPWFIEEIVLNRDDVVVILDDDTSIHSTWNTRFKQYIADIQIKHFTSGTETVNFIHKYPKPEKILLLTDYELLRQELTGLHIIKQTAVKRSVLVTNHYANKTVQDLVIKAGTKMLPKLLASEISIVMSDDNSPAIARADIVIVDDNEVFAKSLARLLHDKKVDVYNHPERFLEL